MFLRRPYGAPGPICGTAFPTLKRGANVRCAYGAFIRTILMQSSIKRGDLCKSAATYAVIDKARAFLLHQLWRRIRPGPEGAPAHHAPFHNWSTVNRKIL